MCFSAEADLLVGLVVVGVGVDAIRHTTRRSELPIAALPLLLGVHQVIESLVWLGLERDVPDVEGLPSEAEGAAAPTPSEEQPFPVGDIGVVPDEGGAFGAPGLSQRDPRFGDIRIAAIPLEPTAGAVSVPTDRLVAGTWFADVALRPLKRV